LLDALCVHISLSEDWCRFLITHCSSNYRNFALTHTLHTHMMVLQYTYVLSGMSVVMSKSYVHYFPPDYKNCIHIRMQS